MAFALLLSSVAIVAGALALAARLWPAPRPLGDRAVLAGVLAIALPIACVRALSPLRWLAPVPVTIALIAVGGLAVLAVGRDARDLAKRDARAAGKLGGRALVAGTAAPLAWLGVAALGCAAVAAWRFAPWAWDALGYHLPIVNDAIATRTLRVVPTNIPYVNAYPRAVETFFVAARLLLADDTWIDLAQAPFGVVACVTTAAFARRLGAGPARAAAFGVGLLAVPLVMLQLASDYVDVAVAALLAASAYFATGPRFERSDLAAWALATGLFLGSKPSAPPVVVLLSIVVIVRSVRARELVPAFAACAAVLLIGGETYFANLVAHGNPIWPIALDAGPVHLPGEDAAGPLFVQGLPPELAHASWARRVLASLFAAPRQYIYDMRLGGLGPLAAWGLLPLAAIAVVRAPRRAWPALLLAACALASPAAHWMRYALALPIALLALGSIAIPAPRWRALTDLALVALAVVGLARALPGLEAGASGIDGHEALWAQVREKVGPGESFAYDASFSLPGQLTCADGRAGAPVYLGEARTPNEVDRAIAEGHARVVVAGDGSITAAAIHRARDEFTLVFRCPLDPCDVYVLRDAERERVAR